MADAKPVSIPKQPRTLPPNKLGRSQYEQPQLFAIVPYDTTFEEVVTPGYWANHIPQLAARPFSSITVVREDGTMILDLICLQASPGMARMHVRYKFVDDSNLGANRGTGLTDDEKLQVPLGYGLANIATGERKGWLVRLANGTILVDKIPRRRDAVQKAIDHAIAAGTPLTETPPAGGAPAQT